MKQRVDYIDIAKALAILGVLLGHTVTSDTETKQFLYAFNMPLFFVLSGIFMKDGTNTGIKEFVIKKLWLLMLPYLLWGLIYLELSPKNLVLLAYGSRGALGGAHSLTSLWFLPVMFLGYIYNLLYDKITHYIRIDSIIKGLLAIALFFVIGFCIPNSGAYGLPWGLGVAFVAAAFMKIGQISKTVISRLADAESITLIVGLVISIVVFSVTYNYSTSSVGYILMADACFGNPFIFVGNAILGSIMVVLAALLIDRVSFRKKELLYVGQNTLGLFLVHKPLVNAGAKVANAIHIGQNFIPMSIAISIGCLAISSFIVWLINRYLPVFFGRK